VLGAPDPNFATQSYREPVPFDTATTTVASGTTVIGTALPLTSSVGAEVGIAVGVSVGAGGEVGPGVTVGTGVAVDVGVAVPVGVGVDVCVGAGVAVGASVAVGTGFPAVATVTFALVASTVNVLFARRRKLYVPGVVGILNDNVADDRATSGGVFDPLKYT